MEFYYGVESKLQLRTIVRSVVRVLGGNAKAVDLLLETSAVETKCGTYPDRHPEKWGVGAFQCDYIALLDVQMHSKPMKRRKIYKVLGIKLMDLELKDLAHDPLAAAVVCRLHYMRIPAAIPDNLPDRAKYWKKYYNTEAGRGTVEHYIKAAKHIDWEPPLCYP